MEQEPVARAAIQNYNDSNAWKTSATEFAKALNERDAHEQGKDPMAASELFFFRGVHAAGTNSDPHTEGDTEEYREKLGINRREAYGHSSFLSRMHLSETKRLLVWYDPNSGVNQCLYTKDTSGVSDGLKSCVKNWVHGSERELPSSNMALKEYPVSMGYPPQPTNMMSWKKMQEAFKLTDFSLYALKPEDFNVSQIQNDEPEVKNSRPGHDLDLHHPGSEEEEKKPIQQRSFDFKTPEALQEALRLAQLEVQRQTQQRQMQKLTQRQMDAQLAEKEPRRIQRRRRRRLSTRRSTTRRAIQQQQNDGNASLYRRILEDVRKFSASIEQKLSTFVLAQAEDTGC